RGDPRFGQLLLRAPCVMPGRRDPGNQARAGTPRDGGRRAADTGTAAVNAVALLVDGSVVTVRELGPQDVLALLELHRGLPVDDRYLRFFGTSTRHLEDFVERMVSPDEPRHVV